MRVLCPIGSMTQTIRGTYRRSGTAFGATSLRALQMVKGVVVVMVVVAVVGVVAAMGQRWVGQVQGLGQRKA